MTILAARTLGKQLIKKYKLERCSFKIIDPDKFDFSGTPSQEIKDSFRNSKVGYLLGQAIFYPARFFSIRTDYEIRINKQLVLLNSPFIVQQTILHEIAHVRTAGTWGRKHGWQWKVTAFSMGYDISGTYKSFIKEN